MDVKQKSLTTTLTDWLSKNSLESQALFVGSNEGHLREAYCTFHAWCFDKIKDGVKLELDYMFELERKDLRFKNTRLQFISDCEFRIKSRAEEKIQEVIVEDYLRNRQ